MLINIVHPYTYKLYADSLIIGPREECKERDENISKFITKSLEVECNILIH